MIPSCIFNQDESKWPPFITSLECIYYHNNKDKRRLVVDEKNKCFAYSEIFLYEDEDMHNKNCNNQFEYNFHPKNFKKLKCNYKQCTIL